MHGATSPRDEGCGVVNERTPFSGILSILSRNTARAGGREVILRGLLLFYVLFSSFLRSLLDGHFRWTSFIFFFLASSKQGLLGLLHSTALIHDTMGGYPYFQLDANKILLDWICSYFSIQQCSSCSSDIHYLATSGF
jgi:hypothetical protein